MVAERFATYFEGEQKLSFEYEPIIDEEEDDQQEIININHTVGLSAENQNEEETSVLPSSNTKIVGFNVKQLDPDEIIRFSSDEEESYEESEESEDLVEYDLEDDMQDLQKVRAPVYLADCLRLLQDTENPDSTEAALSAIEQIIKRKPDDLEERAQDLTRALLFMTNIHDEKFHKYRLNGLIALCTFCVSIVVPYLTNQFYGVNHNIQNRLDILKILIQSAQNLSGNHDDESLSLDDHPPSATPSNPYEVLSEFTSDGYRNQSVGSMVRVRYHPSVQLSQRIQDHTKRWSSLERRKAAQLNSKRNHFDSYCGMFFFPLIKDYDNPG